MLTTLWNLKNLARKCTAPKFIHKKSRFIENHIKIFEFLNKLFIMKISDFSSKTLGFKFANVFSYQKWEPLSRVPFCNLETFFVPILYCLFMKGSLTSASLLLCVSILSFGDFQVHNFFPACWVNANSSIEVLFSCSHFHRYRIPLHK